MGFFQAHEAVFDIYNTKEDIELIDSLLDVNKNIKFIDMLKKKFARSKTNANWMKKNLNFLNQWLNEKK